MFVCFVGGQVGSYIVFNNMFVFLTPGKKPKTKKVKRALDFNINKISMWSNRRKNERNAKQKTLHLKQKNINK